MLLLFSILAVSLLSLAQVSRTDPKRRRWLRIVGALGFLAALLLALYQFGTDRGIASYLMCLMAAGALTPFVQLGLTALPGLPVRHVQPEGADAN